MTSLTRRWLTLALALALFAGVLYLSEKFIQPTNKTIAVLLPSRENPFWVEVRQGVEDEQRKLGSRYRLQVITSGDMDAADQITELREVLIRGVSGVVVGIADSRAPAPAIAQFGIRNIPVVLIDTRLDPEAAAAAGAKPDAFIGSDNRQGGILAAQAFTRAFAHAVGPTRVLLIKGSYVHQSAIDRAEGFVAGAKGHFDVIERDGEWSREKANVATSTLVAREKIAGIFASNDDMAFGAIAALNNASIPAADRPLVIGFDATKEGRDAITQGTMYASIAQRTRMLGQEGVSRLVKLIDHEPVSQNELLPVELITGNSN